jgi:Flp pilus assembly protein TadG
MQRPRTGESGQATVEFVALLPLLAVLALGLWQAVVAGQAVALAGSAARSAARARALGTDSAAAARAVLPRRLERGLRVRDRADGGVSVSIRVPAVLPHARVGSVAAEARFAPQDR